MIIGMPGAHVIISTGWFLSIQTLALIVMSSPSSSIADHDRRDAGIDAGCGPRLA